MVNLLSLLLLHQLGSSQGLLVQANNGLSICPTDEIVFWCSSSMNFIQWQIRSEILSRPIRFFFEPHDSSPMKTNTLGSSPVEAHLTYFNDSFLNGTLTIMMATNLSRTTVICNDDALNVSSSATDIMLHSAIFRQQSLQNNIGIFALNLTLHPNLPISETYVVNISPPPPFGSPDIITPRYTAAVLPLQNNVEYNITMYFQACPARFISTITFGRCMFIPNIDTTKVEYIVNSSSSLFVRINCANETHVECGMNGQWNESVVDFCGNSNTTEITTSATTISTTTIANMTTAIMADIMADTTNDFSENNEEVSSTVIPVIVIMVLLITVAVIVIVLLVRLKLNQRKTHTSHSEHQVQAVNSNSDVTYQYLSYKQNLHHKYNSNSGTQLHKNTEVSHAQQEDYATLKRNKQVQPSGDEYSTVNSGPPSFCLKKTYLPSNEEYSTISRDRQCGTTQEPQEYSSVMESKKKAVVEVSTVHCSTLDPPSSKVKKMMYTDVNATDPGSPMVPEVIHLKTKYTAVNTIQPEDKLLNLDMLLIQLNSMSEEFRLFGSAAGISEEILDQITDSCGASYDALVEVCDAWLSKCQQEKTTPTWRAVANILSLIGREEMARNILKVYMTGKLPIQVDVNALDVQGEIGLPTLPLIPPRRGKEVELMTPTSVMNTGQLKVTVDKLPLEKKCSTKENNTVPQIPPKSCGKNQLSKPVPAMRNREKK